MASRKFLSVLDWEFFFSLSLSFSARLMIIDLGNRKCRVSYSPVLQLCLRS